MDKYFNPTESDCQWTRDMIRRIADGGLWRTSFALYKKIDDKTIQLMARIYTPDNKADENIYRVKKTLSVMKYDYSEADEVQIVVLPDNPMKYFKSGEDALLIKGNEPMIGKLNKCPKCGYWHTEQKCPNCKTNLGWSDHRHGMDRN